MCENGLQPACETCVRVAVRSGGELLSPCLAAFKVHPSAAPVKPMKRDWDLIREVLLKIEEKADTVVAELDVEGFPPAEINYQLRLLYGADLIECVVAEYRDKDPTYWPKTLTWEGHDFLDAIRNEDVWTKTKTTVEDKVGSVTFEVLKAIAIEIAKGMLGLGAS